LQITTLKIDANVWCSSASNGCVENEVLTLDLVLA